MASAIGYFEKWGDPIWAGLILNRVSRVGCISSKPRKGIPMAWCASEDEICWAMKRLFGDDPDHNDDADHGGDDAAPAPPADAQLPTPSQLGIKAGILSGLPPHMQVPTLDRSKLDLDLGDAGRAVLAGGSPGGGYPEQFGGGFGPSPDIAPIGSSGPQGAAQVYSTLPSHPINLSAGVQAPALSLEDAARSAPFKMTDQDLANIRDYTDARLRDQAIAKGLASIGAALILPEFGVPKRLAEAVGQTMDFINGVQETQEKQRSE
jgi:hypothetical protein